MGNRPPPDSPPPADSPRDTTTADADPPTATSQHTVLTDRVRKWSRPIAGAVTVIVALWGAVTGTAAWRENRVINIDVTAATYSGISPLLGGAIGTDELRVSIVNTSARAVSVVRGEVLIDDALVGNVVGAAQETASGAAGTPISLPVTVPADTSSKLRMDWRVAVTATRRLSATLRLPIPRRQFRLRLQFEPGGTKTVPVRSGDVAPVIGGWSALVRLQANRLTHLVMLAGARSTAPTVGTLEVWRTDPSADRPVLTLRRPAGWAMPGWFSVSSLPSGTYIYTLSAGDNVVTAGYIKTHCTGSNATYVAAACINGDARKAPPFGNQYVPPGVLHR